MASPPLPRTVLLLGGTGFIGTNLADRLESRGHRVIVSGRDAATVASRSVTALPLEATDAILALVRAETIDTVVHLASRMLPSSGEAEYLDEQRRISLPTIRLARALAAAGVGLTFLSSGGTVYGAPVGALAAEGDPCAPISLYGQAKLELELHLRFLARTAGLKCLIVRPSNPYGPHQRLRGAQGLVSVILGRVADGLPLEIWGDGSVVRDYIHVEDAADAMIGLIERDHKGVVNVGSGEGHSILDIVRVIERATGRTVPVEFRAARPADVPRLVLDTGRLAALGLHRPRSLLDGITGYAAHLGMAHG